MSELWQAKFVKKTFDKNRSRFLKLKISEIISLLFCMVNSIDSVWIEKDCPIENFLIFILSFGCW